MKKIRNILIAGTVLPAFLLGQVSAGFAQQPGAEPGRPGAHPGPAAEPHPAPAAPPRPAPSAPRAEPRAEPRPAPVAPRAEPRAEPRPAPVAPRAEPRPAPVAPRAEPKAEPRPAPRPEPRAEPRAEPRPAPVAPRPAPAAAPRPADVPAARPAPLTIPGVPAPAAAPRPAAAPAARPAPLTIPGVPAQQPRPGQPGAAQPNAAQPVQPGAQPHPGQPGAGQPGQAQPGQPQPGQPQPGQPNQVRQGQPGPQGQGRPGQGQPGQGQPGQGQPGQGQPGQGQPGQGQPGQGQPGQGQPGQGQQGQGQQFQQNQGQQGQGDRRGGLSTGAAIGIGAAVGLAGGFLAATGARGIDDIRRDRRESSEDGVDYIREPGRTIVRDGDRSYVVHDENERFRDLGLGLRTERRGDDNVAIYDRPGGEQILTFTDGDGRLIRRVRRFRDGREVVLIDNGVDGRVRDYRDDVVVLPPEELRIPRDRFIVDADGADETLLYDTLIAPPVSPVVRRYTLDQVRYSPDLRARMRSVDVDTLNFDPGSWVVPADQARKLQVLGEAVKKAVSKNPSEVFLVEGYTDATGNPTDNLSLSDRRAQSVATILTRDFGVPPENLTTQGYGQQYLKENTQASSRVNRRVTLRRITPLLADSGAAAPR